VHNIFNHTHQKIWSVKKNLTRKLLYLIFMCSSLSLLIYTQSANAHPHAWIDLRVTVLLDEGGMVTGLEQEWRFDNFYTLFITEDVVRKGQDQKKALTALADTNLKGLSAFDYFTDARIDGKKLKFKTVDVFESHIRDGRLWMRFVLPFSNPVDASEKQLTFAIYDPTYYVEILHLKDDIIAFRGPSSNQCVGKIVPPRPTIEAVMLARALDREATPDKSLGRMFAEHVNVICPR
jgi:ABC-type uncharacterized transport system substrate-binding protein